VPRQASGGKGGIESLAVQLFGFGKGAVNVKEQGAQQGA